MRLVRFDHAPLPQAKGIVPFAVTLQFEDGAALKAFGTERLNLARAKKFGTAS